MLIGDKIPAQHIKIQEKYNSFMLVRTKRKQQSQKWPYYILSLNNQLLMNTQQPKQEQNKLTQSSNGQKQQSRQQNQYQYQYNISIDAFCCQIGRNCKFVLTQATWIWDCVSETEKRLLAEFGVCKWGNLGCARFFSFYYYVTEANLKQQINVELNSKYHPISTQNIAGQFLKITPTHILSTKSIIFQLTPATTPTQLSTTMPQFQNIHNLINFKTINKTIPSISISSKNSSSSSNQNSNQNTELLNFYHFKSDYALLSDQHFLNCFVRGKKNIGCYVLYRNYFVFWIDQNVYEVLLGLSVGEAKL